MSGVSTATYITAAALAASAAGNYMTQKENNANTNRQYNARNAIAQQGVEQQNADSAKNAPVIANAIQQFQQPKQASDLGSLISSRTSAINGNTITPSSIVDPTANANAPKVVQSDLADKMAKAAAYSQQQGGALAKIGANTDQMLQNNLNLNTSGNHIGLENNFARGDYNVNQAQQRSAFANARKAPNPLWPMVTQLGSLGSMIAAGGGFNGAGNAAGAAEGAVNGAQTATGAPYIASGDYYGAGV